MFGSVRCKEFHDLHWRQLHLCIHCKDNVSGAVRFDLFRCAKSPTVVMLSPAEDLRVNDILHHADRRAIALAATDAGCSIVQQTGAPRRSKARYGLILFKMKASEILQRKMNTTSVSFDKDVR